MFPSANPGYNSHSAAHGLHKVMLRREDAVVDGPDGLEPDAYWDLAVENFLFSPTTLLPIVACLTYLAPAFVSAKTGRLWHTLIFTLMAMVGLLNRACDAGSQLQLGGYMTCSHSARDTLYYLNNVWSHFCFLQVCFAVLGPEDPRLWRGKSMGLAMHVGEIPLDVVLFARAVPLLALLLGLHHPGAKSLEDLYFVNGWQGALLTQNLLISMCVVWWMGSITRRMQALEVLLRVRYWMRVCFRLVLPGLLLLPLVFGAEVLEWRVLRAARHATCAAIAASALSAVFSGRSDIADRDPENFLIIPWLLLGHALTLIPTVGFAIMFNVVMCGQYPGLCKRPFHWPTLSMAVTSPESRFILMFGTPAIMLTTAATSWIIAASPIARTHKTPTAWWSPWDRRLSKALPSAPIKLRETCRWAGCRFLNSSIVFGVITAAISEDSPARNAVHVLAAIFFFGSLWHGILLCTASVDNSTLFGILRFVITTAITKGMVVLLILFILVNQFIRNTLSIPHAIYASTEYMIFLLLGLWPATWMEDARAITDQMVPCHQTNSLQEEIGTQSPQQ